MINMIKLVMNCKGGNFPKKELLELFPTERKANIRLSRDKVLTFKCRGTAGKITDDQTKIALETLLQLGFKAEYLGTRKGTLPMQQQELELTRKYLNI